MKNEEILYLFRAQTTSVALPIPEWNLVAQNGKKFVKIWRGHVLVPLVLFLLPRQTQQHSKLTRSAKYAWQFESLWDRTL